MARGLVARLTLFAALLFPFCGMAHGHAVVVATDPADGAVLASSPSRIDILFNEPVSLIAAQLLDADGTNLLSDGAAHIRDATVEMELSRALADGAYVASYRVVSLDGHPIGGSIVFSVGAASEAPAVASDVASDAGWRASWVLVRAILNAALLGSAGAVLFVLLVARTPHAAGIGMRPACNLAPVGLVAATLSIGVQGGLLDGGDTAALMSPATWRFGLESTFGRSALIAFVGFALILVSSGPMRRAGPIIATTGAAALLVSFVAAGHVVTAGPRWLTVPALLAHTSAVAFWVGSLLPLRAALSSGEAVQILRRFSAIAAIAVGLLIAAGVVIAAIQVRGFGALFTTTYGCVLLAKLLLVGGLLSLAALNKWRLTPALAARDLQALAMLRRSINAELALVVAILVATAMLGTTPPPRALLSEHAHAPEHHSPGEHHAHGLSLELANANYRVTLTFSSAHAGSNDVEIAISAVGGAPVDSGEVTLVAANAAAGVEPIRRSAVPVRAGVWEVRDVTLVPAGAWSIRIEVLISDFEKEIFEGSVELR